MVKAAAVPTATREAFRQEFPNANVINWKSSTKKAGEYVVNYRLVGVRQRTRYNAQSKVVHVSYVRLPQNVPSAVAEKAKSGDANAVITRAIEVDHKTDGKKYWLIRVTTGESITNKLYLPDGTEVPTNTKPEVNEEVNEPTN